MTSNAENWQERCRRAEKEVGRLSEQVKQLTKIESELYSFQEVVDRQYRVYQELYAFSSKIHDKFILDEILADAVHFILYKLNFERCVILTQDEGHTSFQPKIHDGYYEDTEIKAIERCRFSLVDPVVRYALRAPIHCSETELERHVELSLHTTIVRQFGKKLLLDEFACYPMAGAPNDPFALIVVGNTARNCDYQTRILLDSSFMIGLGNLISLLSVAIDNILYFSGLEEEVSRRTADLKVAMQKAKAASQAKSEFLANMSHELRTPLNAILGYTQILSDNDNLTLRQRDGIRTIHKAGEHLQLLINDILDMSKIEAGKLELVPNAIPLEPFLNNIIDFFSLRASEKGLKFQFEPGQELPGMIIGDELRLRQIISNLLSNSIKFTDEGHCTLKIISDAVADTRVRLTISVEDSGPGILLHDQQIMFEPFQQVGDRLHHNEGSGLGLSISRRLLLMMGSELQVTSPLTNGHSGKGGPGSRFFFTLDAEAIPLIIQADDRPPAKITGLELHDNRKDPIRILIVDDKDTNRAVLRDMLEPLGFHTAEAVDGDQVVKECRKFRPDMVLMDLRMPKCDGFTALSQLKQFEEFAALPVVAITASVAEGNVMQSRCLAHGFTDFIGKPFIAEDLLVMMASSLPIALVYDESHGPYAGNCDDMQIPSLERRQELSALASKGDIIGIADWIDTLELEHVKRYHDFCLKIKAWAELFRFKEIEEYLESVQEG